MDVCEPLNLVTWKRFVAEGVLDDSRIRKQVEESWNICQHSGVDPFNGRGEEVLGEKQLKDRLTENSLLIDAALPYIRKLSAWLSATKSIILLIDRDGYVLYADGHRESLNRARAINFVPGVKWTEDRVGTNAIGTALRIKEPITITGNEHFAVASHPWTCSAFPICGRNGGLAGMLDITGPVEHTLAEHAMAVTASLSYAVEEQMKRRTLEKEISLLKLADNAQKEENAFVSENGDVVWISDSMKKITGNLGHLDDLKQSAPFMQTTVYEEETGTLLGYQVKLIPSSKTQKRSTPIQGNFYYEGVIGESAEFLQVLKMARQAALTSVTVHISGETGTGKELLARAIHYNSGQKDGPFVSVNCGAVPSDLLESELFGYAPGAFTGAARKGYKGKIEQADGGTLFLDEIGEIPHSMQVALLRVLEEKQITPIGSRTPKAVDFRIITATNKKMTELKKEGKIREDLFYRVFVFPISLPPIRARKQDFKAFIKYYSKKYNWPAAVSGAMLQTFASYSWPGNFRELFNVLDRIRILHPDGLRPDVDVNEYIFPENMLPEQNEEGELDYCSSLESEKIKQALKDTGGNVSQAAIRLDMPKSTLYRKLKKYRLK